MVACNLNIIILKWVRSNRCSWDKSVYYTAFFWERKRTWESKWNHCLPWKQWFASAKMLENQLLIIETLIATK